MKFPHLALMPPEMATYKVSTVGLGGKWVGKKWPLTLFCLPHAHPGKPSVWTWIRPAGVLGDGLSSSGLPATCVLTCVVYVTGHSYQ